MAEAALRNCTLNFGPQHPAAHGVPRYWSSLKSKSLSENIRRDYKVFGA
jgi:NADH:ubiquinone oxidoreductase subunit D